MDVRSEDKITEEMEDYLDSVPHLREFSENLVQFDLNCAEFALNYAVSTYRKNYV